MDKNSLKGLDEKALFEKIAEFEKELLNLRLHASSTQVKDVKKLRMLRSGIARAKTFLRQKKMKDTQLANVS